MKIRRIRDLFRSTEPFPVHKGRLYERIHFEDLKDVCFLSNSEIAQLIDRVKNSLADGIETRVINVEPGVMEQLKRLGLDSIINFE